MTEARASSSWIVQCLQEGRLSLAVDERAVRIGCDQANLETIRRVIQFARMPGRHAVGLTCPSLPTPLFAGLAVAYELHQQGKPGVCVLVSQAPGQLEVMRQVAYRKGGIHRVNDFFPVGVVRNNVLSRDAFVRRGVPPRGFRLVVAERFSASDLEVFEKEAIPVSCVLFDGRTRKPDVSFRQGTQGDEPEIRRSLILLSPSPHLRVAGWQPPARLAGRGELVRLERRSAPVLVTPARVRPNIRSTRVDLDTRELVRGLLSLRRSPAGEAQAFAGLGLALYNALLASPVKPSELDPIYMGPGRENAHPVHARLEMLDYAVKAASIHGLVESHAMGDLTGRLRELVAALDHQSAKRDAVLSLLRTTGPARVIVADPSCRDGLLVVLQDEKLAAEVTAWTEPVTWAPESRPLVLTAPPPRHREWVATLELGSEIHILWTPEEASRILGALEAERIDPGNGRAAIEAIIRKPTTGEAQDEEWSMELLEAGALLAAAGDSMLRRGGPLLATGGYDLAQDYDMLVFGLSTGETYRAPVTSHIAVRVRGQVGRVRAGEIEPGMLVILASTPLEEDLQAAAFRVWENRPENREVRGLADDWKSPLLERIRREGLSARQVAAEFVDLGVPLSEDQALRAFFRMDTLAPEHGSAEIIEAALTLGGGTPTTEMVDKHVAAVHRVYGIHRAAGRWVNNLARATYLEADDELVRQARDEQGLNLESLRAHFFIAKIETVEGPVRLPGAFIGLQQETTEGRE